MANSKNKRLSKLHQKELLAALISVGVGDGTSNGLVASDYRMVLWRRYKSLTDFRVTFNDSSFVVCFSRYKPMSLSDYERDKPVAVVDNADVSIPESQPKRNGRGKGKKPVKKVFSMALEPGLLEELKEYALNEERSVGSVVRLAIKKYLNG
ncbi:hypothetical protein [Methyloprofundus sp.]|uniref:hypothetical protein n=1 Tax=Methyloprofundus sp. TaxID=2020875 RepID=UPI003D13B530